MAPSPGHQTNESRLAQTKNRTLSGLECGEVDNQTHQAIHLG